MPRKEFDPRFISENPPAGGPVENQPAASVNPETPPTFEPVSVPGSPSTQEIGESIPPPPPPTQKIQESDQTGHTDSVPPMETAPASASSMTSVTSMSEAAKATDLLNLRRTHENGPEVDIERAA